MKDIKHYIDEQLIDGIRNWADFQIVIDFELEGSSDSSQEIELTGDANDFVRAVIESGLTGGTGIFEGIPYRVEIIENGEVYNYHAFIDTSTEIKFLGDTGMNVTVNKKQGDDWINEVADGFGLTTMRSNGEIVESDYTEISYSVNYGPDVLTIATLSLSTAMLGMELYRMIDDIVSNRGSMIADFIPLPGFGVVYNVGRIAWNIIKLVIEIAFIIAMLFAMVIMTKQLLDLLTPKTGTYKGLSVQKMFQLGCKHLDLELQSNILTQNKELIYLPVKEQDKNTTFEQFVPDDAVEYFQSFGDIVRTFKKLFNADFRVQNGKFIFERLDYFKKAGQFIMPDIFSDQINLKNNYTLNTDEFVSNYNINFKVDPSDSNTFNNADGIAYQSSLQPIVVKDKKLVSMKGLTRIDLPFAFGISKSELTEGETAGRALGTAIDVITGIFGNSSNQANRITDNDGALLLSNDYFSIPKLVFVRNKRIFKEITAKWLWDSFHYINSFSPSYKFPNQWKIHEETRIPISTENVNSLLENNSGQMANGNDMIVAKLVWKPYEDIALISYKERFVYTKNIKETKS